MSVIVEEEKSSSSGIEKPKPNAGTHAFLGMQDKGRVWMPGMSRAKDAQLFSFSRRHSTVDRI
jgi:hypothetical protein